MIGIGLTTYQRPEMLAKCLEHIRKHTICEYKLHIAIDTDEDRKGVAARKNECLRALKDCDHIFLFDDDCYPIKDGWIDFFINSGQEHLLFLNDRLHNFTHQKGIVKYYKDCGGVFMYMTKQAVERVGAFNEHFLMYGFEHADYSIRILRGHGKYPMLRETEQYLYSEDYSNPNHKSSISDEEKQKHIKANWEKFFNEKNKSLYITL